MINEATQETEATARDRPYNITAQLSPPLHTCEARHVYSAQPGGAQSLMLVLMGGDASVHTT